MRLSCLINFQNYKEYLEADSSLTEFIENFEHPFAHFTDQFGNVPSFGEKIKQIQKGSDSLVVNKQNPMPHPSNSNFRIANAERNEKQ